MGGAWPGIAQQKLHDRVAAGGNTPFAQDFLAVGVGKGRPALADVAGTHAAGIRRQHHILGGHGAILGGKEEVFRPEEGDDRGGVVKGIFQIGVVGDAGLLPGHIAGGCGHMGAGVGPLDFSQPLIDLPFLTDSEDRPLPPACAGGIQPRLQNLLQGFFLDLPVCKPSDGTAVQNGLHQLPHGQTTSFQHWGSAA